MKALSVIIPAYNASEYIDECIQSTLGIFDILEDLEIIAVNDGSKDDTLQKLCRYAEKYPSTVIVVNKENGGHGSGINIGRAKATGRYLKVLDADDYFVTDALKKLIQYIRRCEESNTFPDMIANPYKMFWKNGKEIVFDYRRMEPELLYRVKNLNENGYSIPLHSFTVKTDLYQNNPIPQIDEKTSYDDIEYILYPMPYIFSVTFLPDVLYMYRMGSESQSMSLTNRQNKRFQHEAIIRSLLNYYKANKELFNQEQAEYYLARVYGMINSNADIYFSMDDTKAAVDGMKMMLEKFRDVPMDRINNRKMELAIKTDYKFFGLLHLYYKYLAKKI